MAIKHTCKIESAFPGVSCLPAVVLHGGGLRGELSGLIFLPPKEKQSWRRLRRRIQIKNQSHPLQMGVFGGHGLQASRDTAAAVRETLATKEMTASIMHTAKWKYQELVISMNFRQFRKK